MDGKSISRKSVLEGSPLSPRVSPSCESSSTKNCGSTRTGRRGSMLRVGALGRGNSGIRLPSGTGEEVCGNGGGVGDETRSHLRVTLVGRQRFKLSRGPES